MQTSGLVTKIAKKQKCEIVSLESVYKSHGATCIFSFLINEFMKPISNWQGYVLITLTYFYWLLIISERLAWHHVYWETINTLIKASYCRSMVDVPWSWNKSVITRHFLSNKWLKQVDFGHQKMFYKLSAIELELLAKDRAKILQQFQDSQVSNC